MIILGDNTELQDKQTVYYVLPYYNRIVSGIPLKLPTEHSLLVLGNGDYIAKPTDCFSTYQGALNYLEIMINDEFLETKQLLQQKQLELERRNFKRLRSITNVGL